MMSPLHCNTLYIETIFSSEIPNSRRIIVRHHEIINNPACRSEQFFMIQLKMFIQARASFFPISRVRRINKKNYAISVRIIFNRFNPVTLHERQPLSQFHNG